MTEWLRRTFAHSRAEARFEPDHGHLSRQGAHKDDSAWYLEWDGESTTAFDWGYDWNVASVG